jgi:hypothetical protein
MTLAVARRKLMIAVVLDGAMAWPLAAARTAGSHAGDWFLNSGSPEGFGGEDAAGPQGPCPFAHPRRMMPLACQSLDLAARWMDF